MKCLICGEIHDSNLSGCWNCGHNLVPAPALTDADSVRVLRMGSLLAQWRENAHLCRMTAAQLKNARLRIDAADMRARHDQLTVCADQLEEIIGRACLATAKLTRDSGEEGTR